MIEADIISSVEFSDDGALLAIGDRGGRVVILARNQDKNINCADEYSVYSTFQSHEPDFDYLKSVEIEEKINKINWLSQSCHSNHVLTTNDKTIKLFRISDNYVLKETFNKSCESAESESDKIKKNGTRLKRDSSFGSHFIRQANCRCIFSKAHQFNIHSVSASCNQEYFISADDLRVNLWSLVHNDTCFTVVDTKPDNMELLAEIITTCTYHPTEPDVFMYATSKGTVKLCDTRVNAICDTPTLVFEDIARPYHLSRYSEAIYSISSMNFSANSSYFLTRNYLHVNVWDFKMNRRPVEDYAVQDYLNSDKKLSDMYEQDYIFDKFEASFGKDDKYIVTGTYDDIFSITKRDNESINSSIYYLADLNTSKHRSSSHPVFQPNIISEIDNEHLQHKTISPYDLRYSQKVTSLDCHPTENIIAVAVKQNLLIFNKNPKS
ncbi:hypothetical protein MXB_5595 [Myxobolus squamalis]|nr:hypothetical protein MXB_5595 [Myxobolus squamalis]